MKVLRLKIYQPHAHYRIPFTFRRRHTYPIPPYSTVIGLICNVLGVKGPIENPEEYKIEDLDITFKDFANDLYLAIYGKFESMTREYIWFRNLSLTAKGGHLSRFGSPANRVVDGIPEHPGGQVPTRIDVLEEVNLIIYIAHKKEKVIEKLANIFRNPEKRLYPLHLGRAEDWIVFNGEPEDAIKIIEINEEKEPIYGRLKDYDYSWIPDPERGKDFVDDKFYNSEFKDFFRKVHGSSHLITSFYHIRNGVRVFEHIPVKLFEGGDFPMRFGKPFRFLKDEELETPLFFAKMKYPEVYDE